MHTGTLVHTSKHKVDTFNKSKENETTGKKREEKKTLENKMIPCVQKRKWVDPEFLTGGNIFHVEDVT